MKINAFFIGLSNKWQNSIKLNKKTGINKILLFIDLIKSSIIYGATTEDYLALEFYKKSRHERRAFITSRKNWKNIYSHIPAEKADIFNEKEKFNKLFNEFLGREWIFVDGNLEEFYNFIDKNGKVIVKPYDGCEGHGIVIVSKNDFEKIDKIKYSVNRGEKFIVEELLTQHPDMEKLNAACINTIRVETMVDRNGKSHISNTVVIMGTGGGITNNAHNGGIMCHVDEKGGFITGGAKNPEGVDVVVHPDTCMVLPGFKIPMWNEVKNFSLMLSQVVPEAIYIGWDIAITPNGPVVIEGNTRPGHCTQACDMKGRWNIIKSYL